MSSIQEGRPKGYRRRKGNSRQQGQQSRQQLLNRLRRVLSSQHPDQNTTGIYPKPQLVPRSTPKGKGISLKNKPAKPKKGGMLQWNNEIKEVRQLLPHLTFNQARKVASHLRKQGAGGTGGSFGAGGTGGAYLEGHRGGSYVLADEMYGNGATGGQLDDTPGEYWPGDARPLYGGAHEDNSFGEGGIINDGFDEDRFYGTGGAISDDINSDYVRGGAMMATYKRLNDNPLYATSYQDYRLTAPTYSNEYLPKDFFDRIKQASKITNAPYEKQLSDKELKDILSGKDYRQHAYHASRIPDYPIGRL
jgi:hypothetical protein